MAIEQTKIRAITIASLKENLAYRSIVYNYVSDNDMRIQNLLA